MDDEIDIDSLSVAGIITSGSSRPAFRSVLFNRLKRCLSNPPIDIESSTAVFVVPIRSPSSGFVEDEVVMRGADNISSRGPCRETLGRLIIELGGSPELYGRCL
jgi:hypothetical protein